MFYTAYTYPNDLVSKVQRYLDENYTGDISVGRLSKMFYCNPKTLQHSFKKFVGMSPIQYLLHKRMESAKMWLAFSYDVTMIGYSYSTLFSAHFKRFFNCTPTQYRRTAKEKETTQFREIK